MADLYADRGRVPTRFCVLCASGGFLGRDNALDFLRTVLAIG